LTDGRSIRKPVCSANCSQGWAIAADGAERYCQQAQADHTQTSERDVVMKWSIRTAILLTLGCVSAANAAGPRPMTAEDLWKVKDYGTDFNHDLYTLDLDGEREPKNITVDNLADDKNPVYSPDGKHVAFLRQTIKHFYADRQRLMVLDRDTGKMQELVLDHFNDALASEWKLGKVESITFNGADDKDVQQWIVYPPEFEPAKKWPFVQVVHGGPHSSFPNDWSFRWNLQLWAAQGYVVGAVNFHWSSGHGQAFTQSIIGGLGDKTLKDVLKSADWFARQPWIDKNRMAAAGGSYGGYMMAWLNGHTDMFKALVCHAGVYDQHAMVASDIVKSWGWELGSPSWVDLDILDKQSAQRFAANFRTPTLVLHGERDFRVPITQGLAYYNTLRQKGVPTRLVYFPDENHWILKPNNSLVWHREVFRWLETYVGKGPTK
jgi:dipeptidyl aminopeptidase/acylaminoacyl peptidase